MILPAVAEVSSVAVPPMPSLSFHSPFAQGRRFSIKGIVELRGILDVSPKVLTVALIEGALIASSGSFIQTVRKTQPIKQIGRRKPEQNRSISRAPSQTINDY